MEPAFIQNAIIGSADEKPTDGASYATANHPRSHRRFQMPNKIRHLSLLSPHCGPSTSVSGISSSRHEGATARLFFTCSWRATRSPPCSLGARRWSTDTAPGTCVRKGCRYSTSGARMHSTSGARMCVCTLSTARRRGEGVLSAPIKARAARAASAALCYERQSAFAQLQTSGLIAKLPRGFVCAGGVCARECKRVRARRAGAQWGASSLAAEAHRGRGCTRAPPASRLAAGRPCWPV